MASWVSYKHGIYVLNITPTGDAAQKIDANFRAIGDALDSSGVTLPIAESDVTGLVSDLASKASASSLTTHTSATAAHGTSGSVVGTSDAQTLTNKTISGASNTLSNIPESAVTSLVSDLAAKALGSDLTSHTSATAAHGATGAVVGTTNTQTLTNKTLTSPAITTPTITGAVSSINGSWSIDGSGNAVFNAEVDCGSILNSGILYSKSSFKIWNKDHDAYIFLATRNETGSEVVYDFTNVGNINASSAIVSGVLTVNSGLQIGSNAPITGSSGFTFLNISTGEMLFFNDGSGSGGTLDMESGSITNVADLTASGTVSGSVGSFSGQLTVQKSARTGVVNDTVTGSYTPNVDDGNQFNVTMESALTVDNWLGTPVDGQAVAFKFVSSSQSLSFNSSYWRTMIGVTVPATITGDVYVTAIFNSANNQFDIIGATGIA